MTAARGNSALVCTVQAMESMSISDRLNSSVGRDRWFQAAPVVDGRPTDEVVKDWASATNAEVWELDLLGWDTGTTRISQWLDTELRGLGSGFTSTGAVPSSPGAVLRLHLAARREGRGPPRNLVLLVKGLDGLGERAEQVMRWLHAASREVDIHGCVVASSLPQPAVEGSPLCSRVEGTGAERSVPSLELLQARARADAEKASADEARARADAERASADEARARAAAESARADAERARADDESPDRRVVFVP
jgi:hypothetical protein